MKIGVVANEFFDRNLGRMGGFGWVAWAAARALRECSDHEVVFLTTEFTLPQGEAISGETRLLAPTPGQLGKVGFVTRMRAERFDVLLTIDWRPHYTKLVTALPRVPLIVWVQDPRTTFDVKRVNSLKLPGSPETPDGIGFIDCTSLRSVVLTSKLVGRPIVMAGHASYLEEKLESTYGIRPWGYHFLPDPVRLPGVEHNPESRPNAVYLGRMDPIKRPWLFFELAERNPDVDFHLLGQSHFTGRGGWTPTPAPPNLNLAGHVGEDAKFEYLSRAWLIVNTSIHEALPISYLEALSAGVPILSMQNPDEVASRFGEYVGRWDGDGREGMNHLSIALRRMVSDPKTSFARGSAGKDWVATNHNEFAFISQLDTLVERHARHR